MYGDLSPYAAGGASLGIVGHPWKEIRGQYFYGDLENAFVKFSLASTREFLTTGETLTKSFGKIQKWFADLGTLAFKSSVAKSDLASAVQTSLGKADTALQVETDPTVPAWAKSANKPTYTASEVGALPSTTSIPQPTSTTPKAPGTATAGTSAAYARGDHVHPRDATKQAKINVLGLLKGYGDGSVVRASPRTDYVEPSDLNTKLNRTTNVNAADTDYTKFMARGESLNAAEVTPAVNGAIAWVYG